MAANDFLAFATDPDANVMTQADYAALTARIDGFSAGTANSAQLNKVWRQSAFICSVLAQFIANQTGSDVLDDGDGAGKLTLLDEAVQVSASVKAARVVTVSTTLDILLTDYAIGLARAASPAAMNAQLPTGPQVGQEFVVEDLTGNFNGFPVTVLPPAGMTIAGNPSQVCNINRGSWTFRYYGSNLWSVAS